MALYHETAVHSVFADFVAVFFSWEVGGKNPDVASVDWDVDVAGWTAVVSGGAEGIVEGTGGGLEGLAVGAEEFEGRCGESF